MVDLLALALSLLVQTSPFPLPAPEEVLSPPAQLLALSDEALEQRALALLNPYSSMVVVWQGGLKEGIYTYFRKDDPIPKPYGSCLDYPSLDYLKTLTAQELTQDYCQLLYQSAPPALYLESGGQLYWNSDAFLEEIPPVPLEAQLQERSENAASLLVDYDDGSQGTVELRLEQGQWKLHSCPLLPNDSPAEPLPWDGSFSNRDLVERALYIFSGSKNAAPNWWLQGAAVLNWDGSQGPDLPEPKPRWGGYYKLDRFQTLDQLKKATQQQLTQDYAQQFIDQEEKELDIFLEQDGRLYGADASQSLATGRTRSGSVLRRGEDWALLLLSFDGVDGSYGATVLLRLEEGQWKADSSPYSRFLWNGQGKRCVSWPFVPPAS